MQPDRTSNGATVLSFPVNAMVGRARLLAERCVQSSPGAQSILIRKEMKRIHDALDAAGVSDAVREQQIAEFVAVSEARFEELLTAPFEPRVDVSRLRKSLERKA